MNKPLPDFRAAPARSIGPALVTGPVRAAAARPRDIRTEPVVLCELPLTVTWERFSHSPDEISHITVFGVDVPWSAVPADRQAEIVGLLGEVA